MSGHSKWSTIKHKKAATDAKRGKVFTRLGREITVAAREGGGDPDTNSALRLAMDRAKAANMPKDNIARAIQRGAGGGEGSNLEEITYEGYGPGGVAILVNCLTDNRNRTLGHVKQVFNRVSCNMASAGAVAWQFEVQGYIQVKAEGHDFDDLFLLAAEAGADDVLDGGASFEVYTPRNDLAAVLSVLSEGGYTIEESTLRWIAQNTVALSIEDGLKTMNMVEKLEDLDDVQSVDTNIELSDELLASYEQSAA